MLENITNTEYIFLIGTIEENDLYYHRDNLLNILEKAENVICLNKDTEQRIKDFFIKERKENLITLQKSELLKIDRKYDYILFTGYLGIIDEFIDKGKKYLYYILNNKLEVNDTLNIIYKNNFHKIISHLIPSEIPKIISEETYRFFCANFYYTPLNISVKTDLLKDKEKNIFIIYNKKSKNYLKFKNIYQSINNDKSIKLLNEDELNFQSIISNKYFLNKFSKIVLIDLNPHNRIFLVNFCLVNSLPVYDYSSENFYDREIFDIENIGIFKIEEEIDYSIRTQFNRLLDNRYSSYKILDEDKYFRKYNKQLSIKESTLNENYEFKETIGDIYIRLLELKEISPKKYFFNPLSFNSKNIHVSQNYDFFVLMLKESDNYKISNEVFSKFYKILINSLLKENNSWFIYNTILRFIHLRTNIYLDTITKLYIQQKPSKELDNLVRLSVFTLSNINVQETVIKEFLNFLKNFKKFEHLELYIYAFISLSIDNFNNLYDHKTISKTLFDSVSYNLFLNENQIRFLSEYSISTLKNKNNDFHDIFSFFINCIFNETEFDIEILRSKNISFSLFEKNPYHYYRLFTTSWIYKNHDFSKILKNKFNKNLCLKNDTSSFIFKSINLLLHQEEQIHSLNYNLFHKSNYNIIHILFFMNLNSFNNKKGIDVDEIFDFYNYKHKAKLINYFDSFYS